MDIHDIKTSLLKLEELHKQLKKIAWVQSHEMRAPLAKILFSAQLLDPSADDFNEIRNYLLDASHELDKVIKQVVLASRSVEDLDL